MLKQFYLIFFTITLVVLQYPFHSYASSTPAEVYFDSQTENVKPGDSFKVNVYVNNYIDLVGVSVDFNYDDTLVIPVSAEPGNLFGTSVNLNEATDMTAESFYSSAINSDKSEIIFFNVLNIVDKTAGIDDTTTERELFTTLTFQAKDGFTSDTFQLSVTDSRTTYTSTNANVLIEMYDYAEQPIPFNSAIKGEIDTITIPENHMLYDVNRDGKVNVTDYTFILYYIENKQDIKTQIPKMVIDFDNRTVSTEEINKSVYTYDVNMDGKVNVTDYTFILYYIENKQDIKTHFPIYQFK